MHIARNLVWLVLRTGPALPQAVRLLFVLAALFALRPSRRYPYRLHRLDNLANRLHRLGRIVYRKVWAVHCYRRRRLQHRRGHLLLLLQPNSVHRLLRQALKKEST